MAWRTDTAVSAAVDFGRHLDIIDDGLDDEPLPDEVVAPAAGAEPPAPVVLDEHGANIFLEVDEVERERRAFEWADPGPSLLDTAEGAPPEDVPLPPLPEGGGVASPSTSSPPARNFR